MTLVNLTSFCRLALAALAAFLAWFGLYSRHHLVAGAPEEEFDAIRRAEQELER